MFTSRVLKPGAVAATLALATAGGIGVAQAATETSSGTAQERSATSPPRHAGDTARLKSLATKLGVTVAQLRSAFDAARPADGARPDDRRGDLAADLAAALNVETAKVQTILDANRPARPDGDRRGAGRPAAADHTALIAALAKGLSLDEAQVTAALAKLDAAREAEHDTRHAAMAAAIAKELGLPAEKVAAALEASRPAGRR